jgi:hypothetical protein
MDYKESRNHKAWETGTELAYLNRMHLRMEDMEDPDLLKKTLIGYIKGLSNRKRVKGINIDIVLKRANELLAKLHINNF